MGVVLTIILTLVWILLSILGLILLILLILLLSPVTYSFAAEKKSDAAWVNVRADWLFHLIRFRLAWREGKLVWGLKIAWKTVASDSPAGEEEPEEKKPTDLQEPSVDLEEPQIQGDSTPIEPPPSSHGPSSHDEPQEERKGGKGGRIRELKNKLLEFREKLDAYPEKMETFAVLWKLIKRLLKALLPRKFQARVQFGMEDPAVTGYIRGLYYMIMPFLPFPNRAGRLEVIPNFQEKVLEVEAKAKGRFTIGYLLWLLLRTYMDKHTRYLIAYIKKN